jgi:hypothetical protein
LAIPLLNNPLVPLAEPGNNLNKVRKFSLNMKVLAIGGIILLSQSGCMSAYKRSIGAETEDVYSRVYLTEINTAWQATLGALKSFQLDVSNRDAGFVQTRWMDNTSDQNFYNSFGPAKTYLKAQYRLRATLASGFYNGEPSVRVSVIKEQMVQRDVLDGWQRTPTDGVEENTLLYRVGRLIKIRMKQDRIEGDKQSRELENIDFDW